MRTIFLRYFFSPRLGVNTSSDTNCFEGAKINIESRNQHTTIMVDAARVCHSTIVIHRPLQELEESKYDDAKL
jgi:hypothetical protein